MLQGVKQALGAEHNQTHQTEGTSADPFPPEWLTYLPPTGGHDEAYAAGPPGQDEGEARSHWRAFLSSLREFGLPRLKHRWAEAKHLIHQNGVTYNVYGDPQGMARPWQLDPIPLLLSSSESGFLEAGLTQRAALLEALLRDLYGPQYTLSRGVLPAELVFGNPAFLRPCHANRPPGGRYLQLYAANIGRDASGGFWALSDRTQCPSGAGYALENRIVLSRMLPDIFRECQVRRLALFFQTLRDTLCNISPRRRDNPRIVLLTPGPYNETYFEHAYLARYLGYTLVEGGDLTVRDNRVFLKVLGGLQPVDVIFRRLDDDYCDPLELRHDSFLGVPGLVQATRAGTVAVANALGSGILETPAFLAFLPGLCRHLLGEELRLPSVPTWWCGQKREREYVLDNLQDMVIKPARPGVRFEPIFGGELSATQRSVLSEKIRSAGSDYVGQYRIPLATAPVLAGDRFEPRHVVIRMYLTARDDSFIMMPGGLTRVAASANTMVVSMQAGGGSKDTWVLSDEPVSTFSLLRPDDQPVELNRGSGDLPSRMADNLFWLGRYAERAEGLTRLLRVILVRLAETRVPGEGPELPVLLRALTSLSACLPGFIGKGAAARLAAPEAELLTVIHDPRRAGSLAAVLDRLSNVVSAVRDRLQPDMWRVLGDLGKHRLNRHAFPEDSKEKMNGELAEADDCPASQFSLSEEMNFLDRTVLVLAAFSGLSMESVTRDDGWRFLDIGRKMERCLQTLNLLQSTLIKVDGPTGGLEGWRLLEALLEITNISMTYRRRYQSHLSLIPILDLLLTDETNPRGLAFQLAALSWEVDRLPRNTLRPGCTVEQRLALTAHTALRLADLNELVTVDEDGRRGKLAELLTRLTGSLLALSDSVTQTYLSHLQTSRHLSGTLVQPLEA